MTTSFFDQPILNSPYEYPGRHWELDDSGQPTDKVFDRRRGAKYITPVAKPKRRKSHGRWDFVEFTEPYEMEEGLAAKVEEHFNQLIEEATANGETP